MSDDTAIEFDYWQGTYVCRRKGFCHVTSAQCLETHELRVCGDCHGFLTVLRIEERKQIEEALQRAQRRAMAPAARKSR